MTVGRGYGEGWVRVWWCGEAWVRVGSSVSSMSCTRHLFPFRASEWVVMFGCVGLAQSHPVVQIGCTSRVLPLLCITYIHLRVDH